jgi:hypothetical protein
LLRDAVEHPWERPTPLPPELLGQLIVSLLSPRHRALLREVLVDVLGEDIAKISLAVAKGVKGGE